MNVKIVGAVVVVIVVAGGWYFFSSSKTNPIESVGTPSQNDTNSPIVSAGMPIQPQTIVITYTDAGYTPAEVTVPTGTTITWTNQSKSEMWIASAMHPTHVVYDGTTKNEHCVNNAPTSKTVFDECVGHPAGSSWSFTFTKPGTWKYHDHITSGKYGSVIVTEAVMDAGYSDAVSI